jgi:voltage-gated potassium channel
LGGESMGIKARVHAVVIRSDTKNGRVFDIFIQTLIVLSLIGGAVESLPNLSPGFSSFLKVEESVIMMIFAAEYLLRVYASVERKKFIFSFFGMVDLVAILPFFLSTGLDLRSIRTLRLFRVIRVLKLARYGKVVDRFKIAFGLAREELLLFLLISAVFLYVASVGIYYCERDAQPDVFISIPHAMWWAVATLTTVGYGDIYPITPIGKLFTGFIVFIGVGLVAIPSGIVATALSEARHRQDENDNEDV